MPGPPPLIQAAVAGVGGVGPLSQPFFTYPAPLAPEALLHYSFPSEADTLAYVDALKHSDLSDWRSLQEVAARAGAGSCSGAVTTSVLTALYLLGLFNLCVASPASCCVPPPSTRRRRRSVDPTLPPLLNNLQYNLSSLSLEQFHTLPHVTTPEGGRVPLHISVVEQVRKLWDSNPRLLSSVSCSSATEAVRSSFISLSGVASGIILAYSVAQLNQCYPDHTPHPDLSPKIWFFPIPKAAPRTPPPARNHAHAYPVPLLPRDYPVTGDDDAEDGCGRDEVSLGRDRCATLLSSRPCPYRHWVLLNSATHMGECVPRLCADNFVYVEADQLCHDVNEPGMCPGGRRLYLTATGTAVCDCPEGMFGGPGDSCYFLHESAYCATGSVLQFDRATKALACLPDLCRPANSRLWPDDLPFAPSKDGYCYQFNKEKPCKRGQRFGYDTDRLEATCVSLMEAGLSRPRRSFMYQQMSFPAAQDHKYHHYQVSYIIMNGTTWDLEVKGIKRSKRDVLSLEAGAPRLLSSGHLSVPFIDTRVIPRHLFPTMRIRRPRRVTHRRARRGNSRGHNTNSTTPASDAAAGEEDDHAHHNRRQDHNGEESSSGTRSSYRKRSRGRGRGRERRRRGRGGKGGGLNREMAQLSPLNATLALHQDPAAIVKVSQASPADPVVVEQTPAGNKESEVGGTRRHGSRGRKGRRKGRRRGKKGRRRRKKKKDRRRGRKRKQRPDTPRNSTRTKGKKKRKNPKLPFRVPTGLSPAATNISEGSSEAGGDGTGESTTTSKGKASQESISSGGELGEDEMDQQLSSSSEMSLPNYLSHRGRRQLGDGGGIIQAPLLSACKPGAKRDFNYKCRPRFIPQGRDRRGAAGVVVAPRKPTITCPKGTRLDPRGKCQLVG